MKVNKQAWETLRKQIEYYLEKDSNLTDVMITYQFRELESGNRNHLKLGVKMGNI